MSDRPHSVQSIEVGALGESIISRIPDSGLADGWHVSVEVQSTVCLEIDGVAASSSLGKYRQVLVLYS